MKVTSVTSQTCFSQTVRSRIYWLRFHLKVWNNLYYISYEDILRFLSKLTLIWRMFLRNAVFIHCMSSLIIQDDDLQLSIFVLNLVNVFMFIVFINALQIFHLFHYFLVIYDYVFVVFIFLCSYICFLRPQFCLCY